VSAASPDWFREDCLHEEYLESQDEALQAWIAWNVDELTQACLGPQVDEILDGWAAGGGELPWTDAGSEPNR